jgi:hypothetical protein
VLFVIFAKVFEPIVLFLDFFGIDRDSAFDVEEFPE